MILRVGLTGGLASGKSSVAAGLRKRGIPVLDADEVVHDLYRPGRNGAEAVEVAFGREFLDASGRVDRRKLAGRVFSDPAALARLDSLVHPLVFAEERYWLEGLERSGETVGVVEATLIVETGGRARYDILVAVSASEELRAARALARLPGTSPDEIRRRLAAQAADLDRERQADIVIRNDGDREKLEAEAERLAARLRDEAARRARS